MLFKARAEKIQLKSSYKLMIVQQDQGKLISNDFVNELVFYGVESNLTVLYMPQQDSVAETSNKIIINDANGIIKRTNCPKVVLDPGNGNSSLYSELYNVESNNNRNGIL